MFDEPPPDPTKEWKELMDCSAKAKDVLALAALDEKPAKRPWGPGAKSVTVQEAARLVTHWTYDWVPS